MKESKSKIKKTTRNANKYTYIYTFVHICLPFIIAYIIIKSKNQNQTSCPEPKLIPAKKPIYTHWCSPEKEYAMNNLHSVFKTFGFQHDLNSSDWDLLWAYQCAYPQLNSLLKKLKPHQLVNQIPGTKFYTGKVSLATTPSKYIPKAFALPGDRDKLHGYVKQNPNARFVVKNNSHRGIKMLKVEDIDLTNGKTFVQEFVESPYLVDGHKFEFGIFCIITSIDPLRVYAYKGDILHRFCVKEYNPFDPEDLFRYVITEKRLTEHDMPSLSKLVLEGGFSFKNAVENYIRQQGDDPSVIWTQVEDFIGEFFLLKKPQILREVSEFASPSNFFQIIGMDFMIDEDMKLHVIEMNLSPNVGSVAPERKILYKQIIYNTMPLVGIGSHVHTPSFNIDDDGVRQMQGSDKNILVLPHECMSERCKTSCEGVCALCQQCLDDTKRSYLIKAYREHMNRNDCRRLYPPSMIQGNEVESKKMDTLSPSDKLMYMWFQAKCNEDITFCT